MKIQYVMAGDGERCLRMEIAVVWMSERWDLSGPAVQPVEVISSKGRALIYREEVGPSRRGLPLLP